MLVGGTTGALVGGTTGMAVGAGAARRSAPRGHDGRRRRGHAGRRERRVEKYENEYDWADTTGALTARRSVANAEQRGGAFGSRAQSGAAHGTGKEGEMEREREPACHSDRDKRALGEPGCPREHTGYTRARDVLVHAEGRGE